MTNGASEATTPVRILVADDDPGARDLLTTFLDHKGYDVVVASNGEEAIQHINDRPPDLIVLDIMMPKVNGLEVLEDIRRDPHLSDIPVILLTALGDTADVVRGLELGATDYIVKPVKVAELAARVRNQIRAKQMQDHWRVGLERLQELDTLKDKFFQIATHDLKSPLGTLAMGIQLLDEDSEEMTAIMPEYDRILRMMSLSVTVMESIIEDYLDLQTIKAGHLKLTTEEVSPNQIISQVAEYWEPYAETKNISIAAELDTDLRYCQCDPDRILQIVNNLVSNAVKFTDSGGRVTVRTIGKDDGFRVEVEDDGPGIRKDEIPRLFDEFTRLSNRPTGGEKSSGVGLAISRYLIEMHKGKIGVESEVGAGSTFWFEIPC